MCFCAEFLGGMGQIVCDIRHKNVFSLLEKTKVSNLILPRGCMGGEAFNKQSHCYYESNAL